MRSPVYPVVLDGNNTSGVDANGERWFYDDILSAGDRVGRQVGDDVFPPMGTVVERDGALVIELAGEDRNR